MPISLRGTASNQAANGGAVTITLPGGTAQDDVVFVGFCCGDNDNVDLNVALTTSGYTELADLFSNGTSEANLGVFRKVQGATPDTTVVMSALGGTDAGNAGAAIVLTGVDTTTPEDATTTTATGTGGGNANPPSITTATNNAWVIAFGGSGNALGTGFSAGPSGYSDFVQNRGNDTTDGSAGLARLVKTTAGAEDPGAFTYTTASAGDAWCAATVAARPADGGGAATSLVFNPTIPAFLAAALMR